MDRTRRMLQLALQGAAGTSTGGWSYSVVSLLQENKLILVDNKEIKACNMEDVHLVTYGGTLHKGIIVDTGGKLSMENLLKVMQKYSATVEKIKVMNTATAATQTEIYLNKAAETQTEVAVSRSPPLICSDNNTFTVTDNIPLGEFIIGEGGQLEGIPHGSKMLSYGDEDVRGYEETRDTSLSMSSQFVATEASQSHSGSFKRKKQFCKFCKKHITNLPRHLRTKHANEDEIQELIKYAPKDERSRQILNKIRVQGYVEGSGNTNVIVRKGAKSYSKCEFCGGLYSKKNMYRHHKRCSGTSAPKNLSSLSRTKKQIEETEETDVKVCEEIKRIILPGIRDSNIIETILNDRHIIKFGNSQCMRFGNEIEIQKNLVRSRLRNLAKVKIMMSHVDSSVKSFVDIFDPEKWESLMEVIEELAHLKETNVTKKSPNVVHHLGQLLSNLAKDIKSCIWVKTPDDSLRRQKLKCWIEMYGRQYGNTIGCQATKVSREKKWKKKKFLPLAKDLLLFNNYIKQKIDESKQKLMEVFDGKAWEDLTKACMIWLLSYNRKRAGELTNITIEDYKSKAPVREGTDVFLSLTPSEKVVSDGFYHVDIRGKWTRPVSLLIKTEIAEAIDMVISFRDVAGVFNDNKHLFANRGMTFYNASVVLTEIAYACGAESPEDITSTNMRQHMATMSQAMNLTDNDFRVLCGYLGHTTQTHLTHYRRPSDAIHAARLSKLLSAFDDGTISQYRGKSLDDIDVSDTFAVDILHTEEDILSGDSNKSENQPTSKSLVSHFMDIPSTSTQAQRTPTKIAASPDSSESYTPETPSPAKRKRKVIKWSTPERHAMKRHFQKNIDTGNLPTFLECHRVKGKEASLARRKVAVMKAWVNNQAKKQRKEVRELSY